MPKPTTRIVRVIEYTGPQSWVDATIERSISGVLDCAPDKRIVVSTVLEDEALGHLESILRKAEKSPRFNRAHPWADIETPKPALGQRVIEALGEAIVEYEESAHFSPEVQLRMTRASELIDEITEAMSR